MTTALDFLRKRQRAKAISQLETARNFLAAVETAGAKNVPVYVRMTAGLRAKDLTQAIEVLRQK